MLAWLDEGDRRALPPGATRPADAMHVDLGGGRHVEVHHVADVLDIEAAGGDVGRDEDIEGALAEATHDAVALLLGEAAMERRGVVATAAQRLGQVVDLA